MTPDEVASGRTFPAIDRIRDVSHAVAVAVIQVALDADLTTKVTREDVPTDDALDRLVASKMYDPKYVPLVDPRRD